MTYQKTVWVSGRPIKLTPTYLNKLEDELEYLDQHKVTTEPNKTLSSKDFTCDLKNKLDQIEYGAQCNPANYIIKAVATKADQGGSNELVLFNSDNTRTTFTVQNGKNGERGEAGKPGTNGIDGKDGKDGKDGARGEQGARGVPGFNGQNGRDGISVTHSWDGSILSITSASGTSCFDLRGPKGQKGNTGSNGKNGYSPKISVYENNSLSYKLLIGTEEGWFVTPNLKGGLSVDGDGEAAVNGIDGVTFIPRVSTEGVLSWTNDGNRQNPNSVNIKGPQGPQGQPGVAGHTPVITIGTNNHWYVDAKDTGVTAVGPQGPAGTGQGVTSISWKEVLDTPETLDGYGITDAMTKTAISAAIEEAITEAATATTATDGISILSENNKLKLPDSWITYLQTQTFQKPTISTFQLLDSSNSQLDSTYERGTTITLAKIKHKETNIANIKPGTLQLDTLKFGTTVITPVEEDTTIDIQEQELKTTTSFKLTATDTMDGSVSASKTITFNNYAYSAITSDLDIPTSGTKQKTISEFSSTGNTFTYKAGNYLYLYTTSANQTIQTYVVGQWTGVTTEALGQVTFTQANGTKYNDYYAYRIGPFLSDGSAMYKI